jgi:hypothetical protein
VKFQQKQSSPKATFEPAADLIVQLSVWLLGISPIVWRCLLVSAECAHSGEVAR